MESGLPSGLYLFRGAVSKPFDPKELKYAASNHFPAGANTADLTRMVGLVDGSHDSRAPIGYQGSIGACVGWSTTRAITSAVAESAFESGDTPTSQLLHPGIIYEDARKLHPGWFPNDTGSVPNEALDLMLEDAPLFDSYSYIDRADFEYPRSMWADGKIINYLGSHRPIYISSRTIEEMWIALSLGMPIVLSGYWPDAWMTLRDGKIPEGTQWTPNIQGHSTWISLFLPGIGFVGENSWSEQWTPTAPRTNRFMRPGSFLIPFSYFVGSSPFWDIRAISPERVILPTPPPIPEPDPEPLPPKPLPPEPVPPQPLPEPVPPQPEPKPEEPDMEKKFTVAEIVTMLTNGVADVINNTDPTDQKKLKFKKNGAKELAEYIENQIGL